MSDDPNNKPDSEGDATATSAAGESQEQKERTFTQAELNAIVAKEKAKEARATEKRLRQESDAAQKKEPSPAPGSEELLAKVAALEAKTMLAEAFEELDWKPSKEQSDILRDVFKTGGADVMKRVAATMRPAQQATTEAKVDDAGRYKSPGAPSGAPREVLEGDATKWSRDYVEQLRSQGKLLSEIGRWRTTLPGGGDGLFRKRAAK